MSETLQSTWDALNWVDFILLIGFVACFMLGVAVGFYRQLALLLAAIVGGLLASQFTAPLASASWLDPVRARYGASGAEFAAFSTILLASLVAAVIAILVFRSFFGKTLETLDSFAGGVLGLGLGALTTGLLLLALFHWPETALHPPVRASFLGARLAEGARVASRAFPEEYRRRVERSLEEKIPQFAAQPEDSAPAAPTEPGPRRVE